MSEDKDSGNSGGGFPNFNHLLLVLLAGTLFVSQTPYHESRPEYTPTKPPASQAVNARPWQDPFEAVEIYTEKHRQPEKQHNLEYLKNTIKSLKSSVKELNIVAVYMPGGPYFEDQEARRKIRYAVLSAFNTALNYMPEDNDHIDFFDTPDGDRQIYEWLVSKEEKNIDYKQEKSKNGNTSQSPWVLVLWLNQDSFKDKPHQKLKTLIESLEAEKVEVAVLGPFDSEVLKDLVDETAALKSDGANDNYRYFSPSSTVEENVLQANIPRAQFDDGSCSNINAVRQNPGTADIPPNDLQSYFKQHGLWFLRVTATDQCMAHALKKELDLYGVEPNKNNRILLVGEWNSLYDHQLSNSFTKELLKDSNKESCPDSYDESNPEYFDKQFDPDVQCVIKASYLRGLDGEKITGNNTGDKSANDAKKPDDDKGLPTESMEDANGDSQFDYVRRLAARFGELDKNLHRKADKKANTDSHIIKAIGILGSDVYDKLLIAEAFHDIFPDAVFFTNNLDATFLESKYNRFARGMIMASSFGLELHWLLQQDIPPFRDDTQTAYFLAAEIALVNRFGARAEDKSRIVDEDLESLLSQFTQFDKPTQSTMDAKIKPRIYTVGRTRIFDLSSDKKDKTLYPPPDLSPKFDTRMVLIPVCAGLFGLILIQKTRRFLESWTGLLIVSLLFGACTVLLAAIDHNWLILTNMFSRSRGFGIFFILLICGLGLFDEKLGYRNDKSNRGFIGKLITILASIIIIAEGTWIIWNYIQPVGGSYNSFDCVFSYHCEPYAFLEGVSMWPSQAIRLIALILAMYFIHRTFRFPLLFEDWLEKHFHLDGFNGPDTRLDPEVGGTVSKPFGPIASLINPVFGYFGNRRHEFLFYEWLSWRVYSRRCIFAAGWGAVFYLANFYLYEFMGHPHIPYRGTGMLILDQTLMLALLSPAFSILLLLVSHAVIKAVDLLNRCFPDDPDHPTADWPRKTLLRYAGQFNLPIEDAREWVGMRFIVELSKHIYRLIGYPLIVALLLVLSSSSYLDNWQMPIAFKLGMGFSMLWLFYWDFKLKNAADTARENAIKSLRIRVILSDSSQRDNRTAQLERLITMIENYDATVYKSFTQRPVFINTMMIVAALLTDSLDYTTLANKFFPG